MSLYGSTWGLTSCADIVATDQCGSVDWLPICPVACGLCEADGSAQLSSFCACFEQGWSFKNFEPPHCFTQANAFLPLVGPLCGAPWYRALGNIPENVDKWTAEDVLSWSLMTGDFLGVSPAKSFQAFLTNRPITGVQFALLTESDLRVMGFTVGESFKVYTVLASHFFAGYTTPPAATYAIPHIGEDGQPIVDEKGAPEVTKNPVEVGVTFALEALIGIDEVNFFFEVQFLLVLSWQDERINTKCVGFGRTGSASSGSDRCGYYWQPEVTEANFPSQVLINIQVKYKQLYKYQYTFTYTLLIL